ncbi:MAG: alpha/beta hydrolase [Polyangiaceae bacterium]
MEQRQRDVLASGVRVRVAEHGAGAPVVLLHSALMDHGTWDGVVDRLQKQHRLYAPDLPGSGESEKPPPARFEYGVDALAHTVADLYAGLSLSRASLVGHGLGGAVALSVAARYPELVQHLVVLDAWCYPTPLHFEQRLAQTPFLGGFVFKQLWNRSSFHRFFGRRWSFPPSRGEQLDRYYEGFSSPAARSSALATLRATIDTRPVAAQLGRIQAKTLVLWGRRDTWLPPALGQRLAREIRGAGLLLLDTGHCPQEEAPEAVAQAVAEFVS